MILATFQNTALKLAVSTDAHADQIEDGFTMFLRPNIYGGFNGYCGPYRCGNGCPIHDECHNHTSPSALLLKYFPDEAKAYPELLI